MLLMMVITPVRPDELRTLCELGRSTFDTAFRAQNTPGDFNKYVEYAFAKAQLQKELSDPQSFFYFGRVNDTLIAYIKINTNNAQSELREAEGVELERIYVIKDHQGSGYGKQLLTFAENWSLERNKKYIWLGVWEHNIDAIRLYEQMGFKKFDTHIYYIGTDPQTDHLMRKELVQ